jgi:molybdopterin-guanine dinucleotide biosynthesis protein A/rhodanese-related sulfurtransferase
VAEIATFTGAVLIGGRSTRMGFDKSTLFVDRIVDVLRAAGADEVLLIADDDRPGNGPLGGIATALRRAAHDVVVVLACDLPGVHVDGIRLVVDGLGAADVALPPGEPLHAAWRRSALPAVDAAIDAGTLAVKSALDALDVVDVLGLDRSWLVNVNEPADLHQTGAMADVPEIDVEELAERHAAGAYVLDVRNPDEYEDGHVPGAVLLPLGELNARWEEVPEGEVLVICKTGARSARAVEALNGAGRTTMNVAGGTLAWIRAGFDVVTGPSPE